jgi:hypothetical protein
MVTKTSIAKDLYQAGRLKECLKMVKTFTKGITKDDHRVVTVHYEVLCGRGDFYKSIDVDIKSMELEVPNVLKKVFNL